MRFSALRTAGLLALSLLPACGGKFGRLPSDGLTRVEVNARSPLAALDGGILVYAQNTADPTKTGAKYLINAADPVSWVIPNGSYRFFAVGYDFSLSSGFLRCADGGTHALGGGSQTVSLAFSTAACGNYGLFQPPGSDSGADNQPKPLLLVSCASTGGNLSTLTDTAPNDVCDGSGGRPAASTNATHYRITLPEYENFRGELRVSDGPGRGIKGPCLALTPGAHTNDSLHVLPGGTIAPSPIIVGLDLHTSSACNNPHALIGFPNGLAHAGNGNLIFRYRNAADAETDVAPPSSPMVRHYLSGGSSYNWLFFREHSL